MINSANKRIVQNTGFLYLRMIVITLIKLYTSRVILEVLGVKDFGIWVAVTAIIVTFNFLSMPLITAIQRFLNFEMGCGGKKLKETWATSFYLCGILTVILIIILETAGVSFLNTKMDFDGSNLSIVNIVFQLSILSTVFIMFRIPFEAAIIAHEKMSGYSILSMIETLLLLGIVLILQFGSNINRLIYYGLLYALVQGLVLTIYAMYAGNKFSCVRIKCHIDFHRIKEMGKYSIWNFLGAMGSLTASSGLNVLINTFFGVIVNAAFAITMQVSNAINQLTNNLMTALNPQLVKSYAASNFSRVFSLTIQGCKFSFLLLLLPLFPLWYNIDYVLHLWLGNNIPEYTALFCRIYFGYLLIASFASPLSTTALASSDIKRYQLILFPIVLSNLIFSYILLKLGAQPQIIFIVRIAIESVILTFRLFYLKQSIDFPIKKFFKEAILPAIYVISTIIILFIPIHYFIQNYNLNIQLILSTILFLILFIPTCWFIGLNFRMRQRLRVSINNYLKIHREI